MECENVVLLSTHIADDNVKAMYSCLTKELEGYDIVVLLDSYMKEWHSAHSEVMITTCLYNHGMKIGDIGGTGEFTPEGYRNRYYIKGVGTNNGTMRWRPPFTMEEIEALGTRDRLFHPVKQL